MSRTRFTPRLRARTPAVALALTVGLLGAAPALALAAPTISVGEAAVNEGTGTTATATFTLTLSGDLTAAALALSTSGIDTAAGLLKVPTEAGYRAFDVFYYLLTSASTPAEREFLGLKSLSEYTLLRRSGTVDPPSYLPAADDAAAAEDFRRALRAIGI